MMFDWVRSYSEGGALPGDRRFYCVWCGEYVTFTTLLDGLYELYHVAEANERIPTEPGDENKENEDPLDDIDIFYPWPMNIGRFGLGQSYRWMPEQMFEI